MAWWYLELTAADADAGQQSSNVARAQRLVLALAFGCFDEGVALKEPERLDVLGPRVYNVSCKGRRAIFGGQHLQEMGLLFEGGKFGKLFGVCMVFAHCCPFVRWQISSEKLFLFTTGAS